jgi:DNA repair protein RadC
MPSALASSALDRLQRAGVRVLSDDELLAVLLAPTRARSPEESDPLASLPLSEASWASPEELHERTGMGFPRASALAAAFELGRRMAWAPPKRGERVLDPGRVHELMRHVAHAEREEFHVVLLDVRGRLIKTARIAEGSLTQCPVSPRDVLREAVRIGAHGVIFVHNHPSSGDPSPSSEDFDLTQRLKAACELVGLVARDHVIVGAGGYYSFVAAGRWGR